MINWIIAGFHMRSSKIHTGESSMLPSFFFHEVLEQLKTNIPTNFCFERVLRCFVTTVSLNF